MHFPKGVLVSRSRSGMDDRILEVSRGGTSTPARLWLSGRESKTGIRTCTLPISAACGPRMQDFQAPRASVADSVPVGKRAV